MREDLRRLRQTGLRGTHIPLPDLQDRRLQHVRGHMLNLQ
jgi:hypothetical protein